MISRVWDATEEVNMRKILMVSIAAAAMGSALVAGSSAGAEQQSYDVSGFDSVSQVGPNHVVIRIGPAASVRAEGPQEMLDLMKVVVEDGELKILPRREHWDWRDDEWKKWQDLEPATYYVTLPAIEAAAMVGGGRMTVDRVGGKRFAATIAGSGKVEIADLSVEDARFSVAGSGDIVANGTAQRSKVSVAGSGNIQARGLANQTAEVSIAGSGDVDLTVKDSAYVSTVGSGDVEIAGGAECTVSKFGGGQTRCNGVVVEDRNHSRWGMWAPPAPPAPPAMRWNWGPWRQWNGWDDDRGHRKHRNDDEGRGD